MKEYLLEEDQGHTVYFAEYGNQNGKPILAFHGGPGSKSRPAHAERYDLSKYRVILFDQRGCGKSTPLGEIENNTTEDLLKDTERIREKLGIDTWFLSGGSWGSTLSLLYAIKYPDRVKGLLLSSIFLADHDSVKWATEDAKGVARLMPDVWAKRMEFFKKFNIKLETQNADILRALATASPEEQKEIAAGAQNWEGNLFTTQAPISYKNPEDMTEADIGATKIFAYYEMNQEFIPDNYILEHIADIQQCPAVIVHGRYDILCPLEKAAALKEKMRDCELVIAHSSGHKLTPEGEMIQKMAYDRFLEHQTNENNPS